MISTNGGHVPGTRNLTAMERLELLFDPDTAFDQRPHLQAEPEAASWPVLSAVGRINGMAVCAVVQDQQIHPVGLEAAHWRQIQLAIAFARKKHLPVVAIFDGSPTRLAGGLQTWSAIAQSASDAAACPAPKVALVIGENTGPAGMLSGLFDAVVMVRGATAITLTDSSIANRVTHTTMQESDLGGWKLHAGRTGLADLVCDNEVLGLRQIRRLLQYSAAASGWRWPENVALSHSPGLSALVPDDPQQSYDVRELLCEISDTRSFLELGAGLVSSIVVGFAPVGGRSVGLIASQNKELAGALDIRACRKTRRHLQLCEAMGVPVVTLVDIPGFLPGHEQECGGIVIEVAGLLRAYARLTVPKITIVIGKALGAAGIALGSRATGPDRLAAWRGASVGLMGANGARDLAGRTATHVDHALRAGCLDEVIEPPQTRRWLGETVASLCQTRVRRINDKGT